MWASTHLNQAAADAANVLLSAADAADVLLSAADAADVLLQRAACTLSRQAHHQLAGQLQSKQGIDALKCSACMQASTHLDQAAANAANVLLVTADAANVLLQ
jgi:hypothetical protein